MMRRSLGSGNSRPRSASLRPAGAERSEMGMSRIPSILPIPNAQDMFDAEGQPTGDRPGKSAARFFDELEWYAKALQRAQAEGKPY
jgi:hypothetical protein